MSLPSESYNCGWHCRHRHPVTCPEKEELLLVCDEEDGLVTWEEQIPCSTIREAGLASYSSSGKRAIPDKKAAVRPPLWEEGLDWGTGPAVRLAEEDTRACG